MDRNKVIKALECRKNADKRCGNPCEDTGLCPYATAVRGLDGEIYRPFICDRERICADALALLKAQKIEEPHSWEHIWDAPDYTFKGRCRNCGFIYYFIQGHDAQYRFCPQCGEQKVI